MNIEYLREFAVFSQSMNYTAAAKELFISQPTLSQHIAALEKDLGVDLVNHASKPQLTQVGSFLSVRAFELCSLHDTITEECRSLASQVHSQIKIMDFRGQLDIPSSSVAEALNTLDDKNTTTRFVSLPENPAAEAIGNQGEIDITFEFFPLEDTCEAIAEKLGSSIDFFLLPPQRCKAIIARSHPLAQREHLSLGELAEFRIILLNTPFMAHYYEILQQKLLQIAPETVFARFPRGVQDFGPMLSGQFANIVTETSAQWLEESSGGSVVGRTITGFDSFVRPAMLWSARNPNPSLASFVNAWKAALPGQS